MAEDTNGFELHLDRAPLKYDGLQPWEILISEAQERMTVAVPPDKLDAFLTLAAEMNVEATDLGEFTDSGYYHCLYQGQTVTWLPMAFLHEGVPQLQIPARWVPPQTSEPQLPAADIVATIKQLLGALNVCSKESVVRRYDHEVQAGTVVKPLTGVVNDGPSDAAVVRPLPDRFAGVVTAHGICPRLSDIDTYHMTAVTIDEAVRRVLAVGGDPDRHARRYRGRQLGTGSQLLRGTPHSLPLPRHRRARHLRDRLVHPLFLARSFPGRRDRCAIP